MFAYTQHIQHMLIPYVLLYLRVTQAFLPAALRPPSTATFHDCCSRLCLCRICMRHAAKCSSSSGARCCETPLCACFQDTKDDAAALHAARFWRTAYCASRRCHEPEPRKSEAARARCAREMLYRHAQHDVEAHSAQEPMFDSMVSHVCVAPRASHGAAAACSRAERQAQRSSRTGSCSQLRGAVRRAA